MTADQLIRYLSDLGFAVIFVAVAVEAIRHPSRSSIMVAAFFGGIALVAAASLVPIATGVALPLAFIRFEIAVLMALPWLLLNVSAEFRPIPRPVRWLATVGMIVTGASGFGVQQGIGIWYVPMILGYFVVVTAYATWRFIGVARASRGVTRRRMQAVATGSGFLALAIALSAVGSAYPQWATIWTGLTRLCGLLCVLSYFVGFAPPRTLRRLWQDSALRGFIDATTTVPLTADVNETMAILNASISDLLGTPGTAIALWDAEAQVLVAPGRPPPPSDFRRGSSIATRVFETQQAMFVTDAPRADPQNAEVYRLFGANALMVAPMNAGGRSMGVVSAFADRPSIFGREDLSLLEVLARELGGFLHRRELVEQMTHVRAQEEAMRLKDEFLSAAAHDLRTPLTVIIGQTQLMERRRRQNPEAPANETAISTVLTEAQRMRDLTEDLLSISRAEAAGFIAERVPTSLGPIAQEVAAGADARSDRHHVLVTGDEVSAPVDGPRLKQVLTNLVDNAIKFSPDGGNVTIALAATADEAHLTVSDEGIGVPAEDLDLIFGRFQRGSSEQALSLPGTGVGLFICCRIVEEHGGRIWAERGEPGSRFHVTLPLAV